METMEEVRWIFELVKTTTPLSYYEAISPQHIAFGTNKMTDESIITVWMQQKHKGRLILAVWVLEGMILSSGLNENLVSILLH